MNGDMTASGSINRLRHRSMHVVCAYLKCTGTAIDNAAFQAGLGWADDRLHTDPVGRQFVELCCLDIPPGTPQHNEYAYAHTHQERRAFIDRVAVAPHGVPGGVYW